MTKEFISVNLSEMKTKLKAFTLMELLVVMVISSLVIMLTYQLITFFYKEYYSYKDVNNVYYYWNKLEDDIAEDVFKSKKVEMKSNSFLITTSDQEIEYVFESDQVLRITGFEDVYPIEEVYFEFGLLESSKLVDEITCNLSLNELEYQFRIKKHYDYLSIFASNGQVEF